MKTKTITLHRIEQGICPYCGSDDIEFGVLEYERNSAFYPVRCGGCERKYEEWYELRFVGQNVGGKYSSFYTDAGDEGVEIEVEEDF